ncbi:hypothetical protein H0H93_009106 [Arthromyces matolae]|nr:hypothetical protein H0H93_009106 [Arthromyces matolae]
MFARLSAAVLLALPLFAAAQNSCTTQNQQCCNSLQDAHATGVAEILDALLGVAVEDITAQVGCNDLHTHLRPCPQRCFLQPANRLLLEQQLRT